MRLLFYNSSCFFTLMLFFLNSIQTKTKILQNNIITTHTLTWRWFEHLHFNTSCESNKHTVHCRCFRKSTCTAAAQGQKWCHFQFLLSPWQSLGFWSWYHTNMLPVQVSRHQLWAEHYVKTVRTCSYSLVQWNNIAACMHGETSPLIRRGLLDFHATPPCSCSDVCCSMNASFCESHTHNATCLKQRRCSTRGNRRDCCWELCDEAVQGVENRAEPGDGGKPAPWFPSMAAASLSQGCSDLFLCERCFWKSIPGSAENRRVALSGHLT